MRSKNCSRRREIGDLTGEIGELEASCRMDGGLAAWMVNVPALGAGPSAG
jgi:hypothetical protein